MHAHERDELIQVLKARFETHMHRHEGVAWAEVEARLAADAGALRVLAAMEATGGEPDVVGGAGAGGRFTFCDCAKESPSGRRSLCYDGEAREARKAHAPRGSAVEMAAELGVALLTEAEYRALQEVGEFDTTTSSWVATPADVRARGGALFCDRRYGRVFVYHNGAPSYYAARGFRGAVRV